MEENACSIYITQFNQDAPEGTVAHCKSLIDISQCIAYARLHVKKSNIPMFSPASQSNV